MLAIALTVALFGFWALLGYVVVWPLETRLSPLRKLLIAPTVGMVVHALPAFLLNLAGIPVGKVALLIALVLAVTIAFLWWWFKPAVPWREARPFGGTLLLALALVGLPMMLFGFNWVSYCNDDMANYCLGADRIQDHGYFDAPTPQEFVSGRDYAQLLWFLHVPGMHRPGSEMILAQLATCTHLTPVELFMPTILAIHLCLIAAAGALLYSSENLRLPALLTCGLLAISGLVALGTLYQLIAQVSGLALMCVCATLLMRPMDHPTKRDLRKVGVLTGVVVTGQLIFYPEVFPFLGVSFLLYTAIGLIRRTLPVRPLATVLLVASGAVIVLLNFYTPPTLLYLIQQVGNGTAPDDPQYTLFPYYLMPSGLANLWGLQPLATPFYEPMQSIVIALGALLLIAALASAVWFTWRGQPAATFSLVMIGMGLFLFRHRSGFGLFKLSMYLQPFLLGMMAVAWFALMRNWSRRVQVAPLLLLGLLGIGSLVRYVRASCGIGATFNELLDPSGSRIFNEFRDLVKASDSDRYVTDSYNLVLTKFQALGCRGKQLTFPSHRFFNPTGPIVYPGFRGDDVMKVIAPLLDAYKSNFVAQPFKLKDPADPNDVLQFTFSQIAARSMSKGGATFVLTTGRQSPFNRRYSSPSVSHNFEAVPEEQVRDHLIFVSSELGQPYFSGPKFRPIHSLYQLEYEPMFFTGHTMAGIGRYMFFQVVNPSPRVRLVMEMTASYKADGHNSLPPADVIGAERTPFGMVGRGSARIFSPQLVPQVINGQSYVAIDMMDDGTHFPSPRTGLMRMFGTRVAIDRRKLVGFGRDVSLISEQRYAALNPPARVEQFTGDQNDLLNPDLEYSGVYEDGWVAEDSFFRLKPGAGSQVVVMKGTVPGIGNPEFRTEAQLLVDGVVIARTGTGPGDFELRGDYAPPGAASPGEVVTGGLAKVELRFTQTQRLPSPDNRPVAAKIHSVGFEPRPAAVAGPVAPAPLPAAAGQ